MSDIKINKPITKVKVLSDIPSIFIETKINETLSTLEYKTIQDIKINFGSSTTNALIIYTL